MPEKYCFRLAPVLLLLLLLAAFKSTMITSQIYCKNFQEKADWF
jgi:hypothetical protein